MFKISQVPIPEHPDYPSLQDPKAGARVVFEGLVRNHHRGNSVKSLEYEAYELLAEKEGAKILAEATERFDLLGAICLHRVGHLQIGDMAVWVEVIAAHREAAFDGCRYIIDACKARVPIWKREHYVDKPSVWVNCTEEDLAR